MNNHVKIASILGVLALVGIIGTKFALPIFSDMNQADTSDARATKGKISIAYDSWVGYFPMCSPEMKKRLRQSGYLLDCISDNANYSERFSKLSAGEYDFAVSTVDSYIVNGDKHDYPGVIVSVIDESSGGDSVVGWKDKSPNLDALKGDSNIKVAYTPDSPSEHLIKALSVHFDIPRLKNKKGWSVETDGSSSALEKLLSKEVDVAVLWEPDVSKALAVNGIDRIIGTEDTNQLIVDVLLASRSLTSKKPEVVDIFLASYFRALKHYRDNPDELIDDLSNESKLGKKAVKSMLGGVKWATLTDNVQNWYGVAASNLPQEDLIDTIESTVDILVDHGSMKRNPIPNGDPYRLTNSQFVKRLYDRSNQNFGSRNSQGGATDSLIANFDSLNNRSWDSLREIGTLKIRPIVFASGTSSLTIDGKLQIDSAVENLKHYPRYRVEVRGHTGLRGDKDVNQLLSAERADSVKRYIAVTYGIDEDRIRAVGFGSAKPLPRRPGESRRGYGYRLPRVELVLVAEEI